MPSFSEPGNTAVFTTKFVLFEKKEITRVYHDEEDGAWQFFSDDPFDNYEDVAKIAALDEIVNLDKSVLEIADLPMGSYALRESRSAAWKTFKKL
ncbi:MAG TPA: DUF2185 domain-containing protein [Chitinophagaceae bacterium]|jgi:hypothetical protein|nr:DUF2185 domain-containing protein [Chitinophagaceae bacterium]